MTKKSTASHEGNQVVISSVLASSRSPETSLLNHTGFTGSRKYGRSVSSWRSRQEQALAAFKKAVSRNLLQWTPTLVSASQLDYLDWLLGFLDVSEEFDGDLALGEEIDISRLYKAQREFTTIPLCDDNSITVIIPEGVALKGRNYGHCTYLLMDGFRVLNPCRKIPVPTRYISLLQGNRLM